MQSADYMSGFGNHFATEALENALPQGMNSPQKCPYGLYAEQLSGSPFTAPNHNNKRTWLYRIRPSVKHHGRYRQIGTGHFKTAPASLQAILPIAPLRWDALPLPSQPTDFIDGMHTITLSGDVQGRSGMGCHIYVANKSMQTRYFFNADGELLIVPEKNALQLETEFGMIEVTPGEIAVIPRGVMFRVLLTGDDARGYVCENYGAPFELPYRGPIGANCLANSRDFLTPSAQFSEKSDPATLLAKWCGNLYECDIQHSPLDVVAWHGNYAPYKYDLRLFSPVGAIASDHPDPSIFTVLTSPSGSEGTANIDFVIFPERWLVAEDTFRPPWYHRNIMSEFMGLIYGIYDAKEEGFMTGGASLHNCMLPHGPDADAFEKASRSDLKPVKLKNTLAFMFETFLPQHITDFAANHAPLQQTYVDCWRNLESHFNGTIEGKW